MNTQELWDTYSVQIRKYINARIEWPAVDDILQQVFIKAHEKLSTIKENKAVKSWLYRITQHSIIDRYRKEYWWKQWTMDDSYRDALENDTSHVNEKKIISNISSCLLPMIDSLDEQSQKVMQLYLKPDVNQAMIAEELWISVSNIKVIIHRAKKKLKEKYQQCCYQYTDWKWTIIDTWCSSNCWCENSVIQ